MGDCLFNGHMCSLKLYTDAKLLILYEYIGSIFAQIDSLILLFRRIFMRKLAMFLLLFVISSAYARDFKIEQDPIFKNLLGQFKTVNEINILLHEEAVHYRFDLTLSDVADKASLVLNKETFAKYQAELNPILVKSPIYFYDWFQKLKELAENDDDFFESLDKKLYIQLYNSTGHALLPEYKTIDLKRVKDLGLLRRITRYNAIVSNPEAAGLLATIKKIRFEPFVTRDLTVSKMESISEARIRKIKKAYFKNYLELVNKQFLQELNSETKKYQPLGFRIKKLDGLVVKKSYPDNKNEQNNYYNLDHGIEVFNIVERLPHKQSLLAYMAQELAREGVTVPQINGFLIATPIFIQKNWEKIKKILAEYTLLQSINLADDEYLFQVRHWVKKNFELIQDTLQSYNQTHDEVMSLNFIKGEKPRRIDMLEEYTVLETLFPEHPWINKKETPHLVDRKGRVKYFDLEFADAFRIRSKRLLRKLGRSEVYTSLLAGAVVFVATSGNMSLALSTRSLVHKAVQTFRYDEEWSEFFKSAPADVLSAFLLGAGFTPGRLYNILALGAAEGATQSVFTGQDVKVGAITGASISALGYYFLPYCLNKPMTKGYDAESLKKNRILELSASAVKRSVQGAVVAGVTGENVWKGAIKGGAFGAGLSLVGIWFLGTRYYPLRDFESEDIDDMLEAENAFQNEVGRGGVYDIDRQLILDSNYRVGGVLPTMISASITLPGNVSMSSGGFESLLTMSHEAHHLMQQHQSGVFGFYLFRYLPAAIKYGYYGHPDENFLKYVLASYLK